MAWTTMHFAVGMACTGAAGVVACSVMRRGWRWLPAAMTLGGLWALIPDLPRIFREDAAWLPLAGVLGDKSLERWLHQAGDWFFLHRQLDAQPHEYALHGLIAILFLYNASIWLLMKLERKQCLSLPHRTARAHADALRHTRKRNAPAHVDPPTVAPKPALIDNGPIPFPTAKANVQPKPHRA